MKPIHKEITIVIPVFNEEDGIKSILPSFAGYLSQSSFSVNILFVNDGSTDSSLAEIKKVCVKNDHVDFISFSKNAGLSAAIRAGIETSETEWIGYIDADLQTDPVDFLKLEGFTSEFDLIMGKREGRKDTLVKRMSSSFANWFRDSLLHDGVKDSACPLKIIRRSMALGMPFFKGMHRFLPALVLIQRGKIKEVSINHYPRLTGKSKFNLWNRLLSPLQDTFAMRWMIKRQMSYEISESSLRGQKRHIDE